MNEEGEEEDPRQELVEQLAGIQDVQISCPMSCVTGSWTVIGSMYKTASIPDEVKGYVAPVDLDKLLGDLTLATAEPHFQRSDETAGRQG